MWNFIALFLLFKWAYLVENVFVEEKKIKSQLPMQSVIITTDVVSSNLEHGEVYNIM